MSDRSASCIKACEGLSTEALTNGEPFAGILRRLSDYIADLRENDKEISQKLSDLEDDAHKLLGEWEG